MNVKLVNKVKKVYYSTEVMKLKYQRTSSLEAFQPILPELITQHNVIRPFYNSLDRLRDRARLSPVSWPVNLNE